MSTIGRISTLIGLTVAVVVGSSIPASATFAESVQLPTQGSQPVSISTRTVAPPTGLQLNDWCVTTTTRTSTTTTTDPVTGATTATTSSTSTTSANSTTNVQGSTTTTTAGPGTNQTTTVTTTQNTNLQVTLSWQGSNTPGVNGYRISAHLGLDGTVLPMLDTAPSTTSTSNVVDADYLYYQPSLQVSTLTTYGWTADSTRTAVLTC
jgi:hypothetical protein